MSAPEHGWQTLDCSTPLPDLDFEKAVDALSLPLPSPTLCLFSTFDFVNTYCKLHQHPTRHNLPHIIHNCSFGRRQQVPFFRLFDDRMTEGDTFEKATNCFCSGEILEPGDWETICAILKSLYQVRFDNDADLFCGDWVLLKSEMYDWSTQKMSLRKFKQLENTGLQSKQRKLNKRFADLRHGIACSNPKLTFEDTLLWQLARTDLGITPTSMVLRFLYTMFQSFNRLLQMLDGDILMDTAMQALCDGSVSPLLLQQATLEFIQPSLDALPRLQLYVQPGADETYLRNSALIAICQRVGSRHKANVLVEVADLSEHAQKHRFVYDIAAENSILGTGSVALAQVTDKKQRENGRRTCVAREPLRSQMHEQPHIGDLFRNEIARCIILQNVLGKTHNVHVLIVMPIRNEIKYARPILPYNSILLTHTPVLWTGKSRKPPGNECLPGIAFERIDQNQDYVWLSLANKRIRFFKHLYVIESNSFRFKPIRNDAGAVYYV